MRDLYPSEFQHFVSRNVRLISPVKLLLNITRIFTTGEVRLNSSLFDWYGDCIANIVTVWLEFNAFKSASEAFKLPSIYLRNV